MINQLMTDSPANDEDPSVAGSGTETCANFQVPGAPMMPEKTSEKSCDTRAGPKAKE